LARALERCKTDEVGAFTNAEDRALTRLDEMLTGLTVEQQDLVRQCALITVLDVEEEQSSGAAHARLLLSGVVGGGEVAVHAWRDLIAHCGRVGRLRGGFRVESWVRLLQEDGYRVTGFGTPAADAARRAEALDRYRDLLRSRGTTVDLRSLGAETAPIPLAEMDASVECVPAGADKRDAEPLPWSLLRRGRVLLTGLPGGGKSVAVAAAAAVLADAAGTPLPLVVSLRDVDAQDRSRGFADRLLDAAVKDVPATDRQLVRETLEQGLESGATALLLDSLDETHDRRGAVVSDVAGLCARVHAAVPVLLATRDVAYGQAATLGWDDLRLVEPQRPQRAVQAVLSAAAVARHIRDVDAWVGRRVDWVAAILDRDRAIGETPLIPVLLALLAADRSNGALPATRAEILHAVVQAAVRSREAHRDPGLRLATLNERDSANATLAAFAVEAGVLGDSGGQALVATLQQAVALALARDWGLPAGAAASAATTIVHFWDEIGVFVIRGADETVAPRMELFLDIGDAVQAAGQSPNAVAAWVDARIRDRRHEPLILAAALSEAAGEQLLAKACDSGEHDLLIAGGAAVRQHACVSDKDRERLLVALAADAANPDQQGWKSCVTLLDLTVEHGTTLDIGEVLALYPPDYQVIARAAVALHGSTDAPEEKAVLDALRVRRLPRLPDRQPAASLRTVATADATHGEVVERAAHRLLGRTEEATALVVDLLPQVSVGLHRRLLSALRDSGLIDAAADVLARRSKALSGITTLMSEYDDDGPRRVLDHLREHAHAELTAAQSAPLNELADLYQTLDLHVLGAWPRRQEYDSWLEFVDVVIALGGFDLARVAAEAEVMLQRLTQFSNDDPLTALDPFSALDIASQRRHLNRWHDLDAPETAVSTIIDALFMGKTTARVAAAALSAAPPDIAVPLLEDALPQLMSSRDHQRVAAHALARLKGDEPLTIWARSSNPTLRLVAAERLPQAVTGELHPLLYQLARDTDRYVAETAVRRVAAANSPEAAELLESIASAQQSEWTCLYCDSPNAGTTNYCTNCRIMPPDPAEAARDLLANSSVPSRVASAGAGPNSV
jgi:hypothetical protein